jgi:hypothetical protein
LFFALPWEFLLRWAFLPRCPLVPQELVGAGLGITCREVIGLESPLIGLLEGCEPRLPLAGVDALELGSGDVPSLSVGVADAEGLGLGESDGPGVPEVLGGLDGDVTGGVAPDVFWVVGDVAQFGWLLAPGVVPGGTTGRPPRLVVLDVPEAPPLPPPPELPPGPTGEFELFGNKLCGASKAT